MTDRHPTPPSLDVLLAAVQRSGDIDDWRELVARLTPRIFRVARGLTAWRVLGAQTVVEHAWRAAVRAPGALDDGAALRRRLLTEVVGRALALGDSPRDLPEDDHSARLAAMRAVALLPQPSRAVLVLTDIGGVSPYEAAELLTLPAARLKAELWHARLAVDTLRGAGAGSTPTPPLVAAVDVTPDSDAAGDDDAGVAPLWLEPPPDELLDRIAADLHDRRQRRRPAPQALSIRLPVMGGLLAIVVAAASAAFRREPPRLAAEVESEQTRVTAPAAASRTVGPGDSARVGSAPSVTDAPRLATPRGRRGQMANRSGDPDQSSAAD